MFFCVVIHIARPLNDRCHMRTQWTIPVVCFHALYVAALVGLTGAIRHIEFRFHELKDLWRGILMSTSSIGRYCGFPLSFFYTVWVHIECYIHSWERNTALLVRCKNLKEIKRDGPPHQRSHLKKNTLLWSKFWFMWHFVPFILLLSAWITYGIYKILFSNLSWNLGTGIMDGK